MKNWAITVRKHATKTTQVTEEDYDSYLAHVSPYLTFHTFEKDKGKDHVHMHGVVKLPINFLRKKLQLPGFNILLKEITDYRGWIRYCKKDQQVRRMFQLHLSVQDHESDISSDDTLIEDI